MRLARKVSPTKRGKLLLLLAAAVALAPAAVALRARQQPLPPVDRSGPLGQLGSPGQIGPKPPVGSGGCSITAPTCADVAPTIIQSALGPSPLGRNVRLLAAMRAGREKGPASAGDAAQWAARAFRKAGVDTVRVENDPAGSGASGTRNVVAVIGGREPAKGFVILGAALDGPGAARARLDAACNAALVVDAARAIHAAGVRPLRSIRFILFGGGKRGEAGSRAYARAHRAEMDGADAVIIYDAGDGPVTGYDLEGRRSLEKPLRKALAPAAQFGAGHDTYAPALKGAAYGFLLENVPTIVTNPQAGAGSARGLDLETLKSHVALAALTAYGIADLPGRLGTRLTGPRRRQWLERNGFESKVKAAGTGARGKQGHGRGGR